LASSMGVHTGPKRSARLSPDQVQRGNRQWWTERPMAYDWYGDVSAERFSREWFDAIDARFIHETRHFASRDRPFDRILPFDRLSGAEVLEIGCGMGLHAELIARQGAKVTAVDISPTSIEATSRRLALKQLESNVLEADAVQLPFAADSFDLVWSWGVIHHSSLTARIVKEISRVTRPDGESRVMVYNRNGMIARGIFVRDFVLKGGFLHRTFEETLYRHSDGFTARFYVPEQFEDLLRAFFADVSWEICGQDEDAVPLPRRLRRWVLPLVPERYLAKAQNRRGTFIFAQARRPLKPA